MSTSSISNVDAVNADARYAKLSRTSTFRGRSIHRWKKTTLGVIGGGMLGGRLAREAVLSGVGEVRIWDFDRTDSHNLGNQFGEVDRPKVDYLVAECDAIRPGHCRGFKEDVRHAGMDLLQTCDVLIDCTDDARLVWTLTEISNGLGRPLLRAAVDGTGQMELGRVLTSGATPDGACQLCSFALDDLIEHRRRRSCPAALSAGTAPTLAGGALGGAVAGIALLQAQRLRTGNDLQHVVDREIVLDLTHMQLVELRLERSEKCLSGHRRWNLIPLDLSVEQNTIADLFAAATALVDPPNAIGDDQLELSFYLHPLHTQAYCSCGGTTRSVGSHWAPVPRCASCGAEMRWLEDAQLDRLNRTLARELQIMQRPLASLGLPPGAMVLVRVGGGLVQRLVIRS